MRCWARADSIPFKTSAVVRLYVFLSNVTYFVPFVVADSLVLDDLLGSALIDMHVSSIDVVGQRSSLHRGGSSDVAEVKDVTNSTSIERSQTKKTCRRTPHCKGRETRGEPICLTLWVPILSMSQLVIRVTKRGYSLVFMEPKPS